ncbi:MFS transporter [Streptomyces sp. NPDC127084]|uniref:MFS transporter n=1 Tax=Streptomyces sp. NPDC127084 TaxID=3347133 RepID=UPI00365F3C65
MSHSPVTEGAFPGDVTMAAMVSWLNGCKTAGSGLRGLRSPVPLMYGAAVPLERSAVAWAAVRFGLRGSRQPGGRRRVRGHEDGGRAVGFHGRERVLLGACALTVLIVQMDWFALNLMLPVIARDFGTTSTDLQWVVSGYMLSLGALMVVAGRLADQHGRRGVAVIGLAWFAAVSVFCGSAQGSAWLVAGRVVQGIGAAMMLPVAVALTAAAFEGKRQARAVGTVLAFGALGTAIGPFVGGFFAEHVSWRGVFFLNVPLCAMTVFLMLRFVPESRDESAPRSLDAPGTLTLAAGLVCLMLGVDQGENWGWGSAGVVMLLALGLVLLVVFFLVERRAGNPLVDPALLRDVRFTVVTAAGSLLNITYCVVSVLSALYLQQARGLSPIHAGLVFLALSGGSGAASYWAGRLAEHRRAEALMALGGLTGSLALLGLTLVQPLWLYTLVFFVEGVGLGIGWALTNVATQSYVPPRQRAIASGVVLTCLVLAGAVGVAVSAAFVEAVSPDAAAAASDGHAIDTVLRSTAALSLLGTLALSALLIAQRRHRHHSGGHPPAHRS